MPGSESTSPESLAASGGEAAEPTERKSLRSKILALVGGLVVLSLFASTVSLYRITEVNGLLDGINRVAVPLGRVFVQLQSDASVFKMELDRGLGFSHWKDAKDARWKPRPVPKWVDDLLDNELTKMAELAASPGEWTDAETRARWQDWVKKQKSDLDQLRNDAAKLYHALDQRDEQTAMQVYPHWNSAVEEWARQTQWAGTEYERSLRGTFSRAESRARELQTALEMILVVVVSLSLLLLWLGERALRPLADLTRLAREITRRGLRREDKEILPQITAARGDEVSQLAREFHHMATSLLEREKVVELQKDRLQEQNRLLRDMGELNENILSSIKSGLIVTDLEGRITQCNPVAARWLGRTVHEVLGTTLFHWPRLRELLGPEPQQLVVKRANSVRLEPRKIEGRVYGGLVLPLRARAELTGSSSYGAIIVVDDLTEELDLQERLRSAENLAAVGRLSAQVAHEVRNPLHSLGLEAEMALEVASRAGNPQLKQSLQSILAAVDRLEKITENYLKLSRLSSGRREATDLGEVLESVLAAYAPACEAQKVRVDWSREQGADLRVWADRDLCEQMLGNLMRNALQALAEGPRRDGAQTIDWRLGNTESGRVWVRIEDNGPGIPAEIRERLFTPFVTTRAQGTGLGLSFVKKVAEDHSGTVAALERESGACFEISLPQLQASETATLDRPMEWKVEL